MFFLNDLFPKNPVLKEDIDSSNVITGSNFKTFKHPFNMHFPKVLHLDIPIRSFAKRAD